MYVDSSPRSTQTRVRSACRDDAPQPRRRPTTATAAERRIRLTDAIVSQWLLDQMPASHRHAARR
jgi:hypothetical protein